ncbi:MAG: hypothetical protein LAN84_10965 [Acidobacteriia bacterium]|nr:hypothetical protein [Terriglobia bacterium]
MAEKSSTEKMVQVECYAGFRGDERPVRFVLDGHAYEVTAVEDKWYSPGAAYFRVIASDGNRYILRHDEVQDVWSLTGFRATAQPAGPPPGSEEPGQ